MRRERQHGKGLQIDSRVVTLLFALAVIAQHSVWLPGPVRRLILSILLRAEAAAYSHVYWLAFDSGAPMFWYPPCDIRRIADATEALLLLAQWMRLLGISLRDLPRRAAIASRSGRLSGGAFQFAFKATGRRAGPGGRQWRVGATATPIPDT